MTRSEMIELLNEKYNSSLYDAILDRLEFFSYEVNEKDINIIAYNLMTVINDVKINCDIDTIPEIYDLHIADAVVGDFLALKKALNQLDINSLDLSTAIASVSMGNTSVSYNSSDSDSAKLDVVIDSLKNKLRGVYSCLRKIHW